MAGIAALRKYRRDRGLTQEQLGHELGVTSMTISRWESGSRAPRRREWPIISEKTGIPIADLVAPQPEGGAA